MLLGICALTLCHATVTWIGPADRLERLLPEIGAKIGRPWKASPAIAGEVLFVHVKDVDPDELQKKIAKCLDCEWVNEGDVLYLARFKREAVNQDLPNADILAKAALDEAGQQLKTPINSATASQILDDIRSLRQQSQANNDLRAKTQARLEATSPNRRLIFRLVNALGEKRMMEALKRPRTVFTAHPTRAQEALPEGYEQFAVEAIHEKEAWEPALANLEAALKEESFVMNPVTATVSKEDIPSLKFVVTNNKWGTSAGITLVRKEEHVNGETGELPIESYRITVTDSLWALKAAALGTSTEIKLDDLSQREVSLRISRRNSLSVTNIDADLLERLLNPVQTDPCAGFASQCLDQWADSKSENIVAAVPDSVWTGLLRLFILGASKVGGVEAVLRSSQFDTVLTTSDGWIMAAPRESGWNFWQDRLLGQQVVRRFIADKDLDLDDRATLAYASSIQDSNWLRDNVNALATDLTEQLFNVNDGLVVWGSLTKGQRNVLRTEGRMMVRSLNSDQRAIVDRIVFKRTFDSYETGEGKASAIIAGQQSDPTDVCPNGVPPGAFISFETNSYARIFAYGGTPEKPVVLRVFDRIQASQMMRDKPENRWLWTGKDKPVIGYGVANETVSNLKIVVGPKWWDSFQLIEKQERPKGKPVPWEQLPDEVKTPPGKLD